MIEVKGLQNHEADNVATLFGAGVKPGDDVEVSDPTGDKTVYRVLNQVPFGHKIAITKIAEGEQVTKYGEEIGVATCEITAGEHVHVHNVDSIRGRGDWADNEGDKR
ncbi:MAG: UxaA family hydrolase [Synergistota bacterium]|nr:UxaA family hydrolase [Synergistota bacterium]